MPDLMLQIESAYDKLTPAARKVADYLRSHCDEAQYLSITELAQACEVAEATVFRFCRALGFSGYNDLKLVDNVFYANAWIDVDASNVADEAYNF